MKLRKIIEECRIEPGEKVRLKTHDPAWDHFGDLRQLSGDDSKVQAHEILERNRRELADAQDLLWASGTHGVLIVLQGMDAAGKDGTIKHVMSGVNPQGCDVVSFKQPSSEERKHTFLWRCMKSAPERGRIMIFNRSHYEDVLVVRVHPELLGQEELKARRHKEAFWEARFDDINRFEHHLTRNNTIILKFFLNLSKKEQKQRFRDRLSNEKKFWKFSPADMAERAYWNEYQSAYEQLLSATSTKWAPWYVVPADNKWITRAIVAAILSHSIRSLKLREPRMTRIQKAQLVRARRALNGS